ncbi:ABC transporter permease [Gluconacetobacter diazotrophicus]|uniref:ABC transporter permease n=1 Tax=Gluconacetobacter diazotrophicus TaxID=33996 RepID=A0A7W4FC98_GLUDI|nr:ABC transporter permease [Gluconacetobacter diazotrophicus]MBB2154977.1 ABC transporter permease [Gluconacetobacter diazotrophicus]
MTEPVLNDEAGMVAATIAGPARPWHRAVTGRQGGALAACVLFGIVLLLPYLAPFDGGAVVSDAVFAPPSRHFLLGTDYLGRDVFSRILVGVRDTVFIALAATLLACAVGATLGIGSALVGGWAEILLSRLCDALISIPSVLFGLILVAAFGSSWPVLIGAMAVIYMPGCYRVSYALALQLHQLDFVLVARGRGEGLPYLIRHEILPNMIGPVLTDMGLRFVYVVLLLSNLSFLGLGVQPPDADLGSLVRENILGVVFAAPAVLAPALAIAVLTVGVNLSIDRMSARGGRR